MLLAQLSYVFKFRGQLSRLSDDSSLDGRLKLVIVPGGDLEITETQTLKEKKKQEKKVEYKQHEKPTIFGISEESMLPK